MGDKRESIKRLKGSGRKLAFNLSATHQEINGSAENALSPVQVVGSFLMMEGFSLVFHAGTLNLRALGR